MLEDLIEDLVSTIAEKPSTSEAHFNVDVLKKINSDCSDKVRMTVSAKVWDSVDSLRSKERDTLLKLLLEQFAAIYLTFGPSNKQPTCSEVYERKTLDKVISFLLNYTLTSPSFDMRVLGLMCFKLSLPFIKIDPKGPELIILRTKILELLQNRGNQSETKCLVDFYVDAVVKLMNLTPQEVKKDFSLLSRVEVALDQGKTKDLFMDPEFETIMYAFLAYVALQKNYSDIENWIPQAVYKLIEAAIELLNSDLSDMTSKVIYMAKLFNKYDFDLWNLLSKEQLGEILNLQHGSSLTENTENALNKLEELISKTIVASLSPTEVQELVNDRLKGFCSEDISKANLNFSLVNHIAEKLAFQLDDRALASLLDLTLDAQNSSLSRTLETYFYKSSNLSEHKKTIESYLTKVESTLDRLITQGCTTWISILKALLCRMNPTAFLKCKEIMAKTLCNEKIGPNTIHIFEVLFQSPKKSEAELSWRIINPLHLQRLFKLYSDLAKEIDSTKLTAIDLLLANKLPASCTKDRQDYYVSLIQQVVVGYPDKYDKQMLVRYR
jgi:hypothetical protein